MIAISASELDRIIADLASSGLRAEEDAAELAPERRMASRVGYLEATVETALRTLVAIRTGNVSLKEAA